MGLVELKKECADKKCEAEKLYKDRAEKAIQKDLKVFADKYPERLKKTGMEYVLDTNLLVKVSDGNIEIEDRRGTAFLWVFEIDCEYSYMDTFIYEGRVESVQYVTNSDMQDCVREVIDRLNTTIDYMRHNQLSDYIYSCEEPRTKAKDLDEVFEKVIARRPLNS